MLVELDEDEVEEEALDELDGAVLDEDEDAGVESEPPDDELLSDLAESPAGTAPPRLSVR